MLDFSTIKPLAQSYYEYLLRRRAYWRRMETVASTWIFTWASPLVHSSTYLLKSAVIYMIAWIGTNICLFLDALLYVQYV
jgi:hypothetical protein